MRLLLLSNSTNPDEEYLSWPQKEIQTFLGSSPISALFIPYAAVTFSFDEYEAKVENCFSKWRHHVKSIHHAWDPKWEIEKADAIIIGGGNTWQLVRMLHEQSLMEPIRKKVWSGTPYIGWSAGSNITCPTLRTTNDMPIVDPLGFETLNLIPFQINPHYLDVHFEGFGGETREMRIHEFIEINPNIYVLGLREATLLKLEDNLLQLIGSRTARLFKKGETTKELSSQDDLSFLLDYPLTIPYY
ncbi:MAG: dipeptidase PepE [Candidatus Azobacteroides sp.]|nr:dipeptidase PepE [Candidatus Azobacteroides sp.]